MRFEIELDESQREFRDAVRTWLDVNAPVGIPVRPVNDKESLERYLACREFGRLLGERGWLYPVADSEYGGGGLTSAQAFVLEAELFERGFTMPPYYDTGGTIGSATISVWGSEEQKRRFLPPIYRGDVRTWQLLTEPGSGSDLASVTTLAERDGDDYVLNGQKVYVGSSNGADRFWMIAMTDRDGRRHENLSWFMVDANLPGVTIQPQRLLSPGGTEWLDDDTSHKNTVFFNDVRVDGGCLVGGENNGWKVAATHLEVEHGGMGNINTYPAWPPLLEYCRTTERDGRPLIDDPDVQDGLSDIFARLEVLRLLNLRNFGMQNSKVRLTYEGSQEFYTRKVTELWVAEKIMELLGPSALTDDREHGALAGLAEAQHRAGITNMHPGGTADIQRVVISRHLGLGRSEARASASRKATTK